MIRVIRDPALPAWYPGVARGFLLHVLRILATRLDASEYGLFAFGSINSMADASRYSARGTSDVDTLVVVADKVAKAVRKDTWKVLNAVERAWFDGGNGKGVKALLAIILRCIERQTGMHENVFMCTERAIREASFARIFRTNKLLSRLLAPTSIVTGSALSRVRFLHGNDQFAGMLDAVRTRAMVRDDLVVDLVKSLVMNLALALGGIVLLPLTARATRYAIEATKWSMYAVTFTLAGTRPSKVRQAGFFIASGIDAPFVNAWLRLGRSYRPDARFTLAAPVRILQIHALGLRLVRAGAKK